jgi:nitroimidazol reductase NimA-like FMN-containing flavoprotein (pyridoxamine 5'-phosphate oxidase superfamily)
VARSGGANAFRAAPPAERPTSPPASYGVPQPGGELIPWGHVIERLAAASGYWLGTVTPDGRPHVVPVWGVVVDDDLYLETGAPETAKMRNLARERRVHVHLDDVDDVVIVTGEAVLVQPSGELAEALARAFHAKYPGYDPPPDAWGPEGDGGLTRIDPETVLAWRDMPTATRWRFQRG